LDCGFSPVEAVIGLGCRIEQLRPPGDGGVLVGGGVFVDVDIGVFVEVAGGTLVGVDVGVSVGVLVSVTGVFVGVCVAVEGTAVLVGVFVGGIAVLVAVAVGVGRPVSAAISAADKARL